MRRWLRATLQPLLLCGGLVAAGLLFRRFGLDDAISRAGKQGPMVFILVGALACALGVPRQLIAYAGGLAYGFWPGAAVALLAEVAGCAIDFWWARLLARRWAVRWLERGGRLARLDGFLRANAFTATLTLRLLPVGSNVALNLVAGVSGVAAGPFLLASLLGYVPQTAIFALLGGGVRLSEGLQMGVAAGLLGVSIAIGIWLLRRRSIPVQT